MPIWIRLGIAFAGTLLVVTGCWMFLSGAAKDDLRRVLELGTVAPAQFRSLRDGTPTLLMGRLKALEPLGPQGFVVYTKEQYLRTEKAGAQKDKTEWMALSVPKPRIAVEDAGMVVPLCNQDYLPRNPPHRWQSDQVPAWRSVGDATIRLAGFKAGDLLTADGVVDTARSEPCLQTHVIFAGTRDHYVEAVRGDVLVLRIVALILGGLGALTLAIVAKFSLPRLRKARRHNDPRS